MLDPARAQHDDLVGHRHRLDLVVRDVHHGRRQPLVQRGDFAAHRHPQLGVEVGQRLVEEEDARLAHDGAADRHALALAAGELRGAAVEQRVETQKLRRGVDLALDLGTRGADVFEAERHVLAHGHVRVQRIGLEHHGEPAIRGRHVD